MPTTPIADSLRAVFAQSAPPQGGDPMFQFLILGLLFAGLWFLLIAPQRKRQKQHQQMIDALKPGDKVVTSGGLFGTITNVRKDRFTLKIAENTRVEIGRGFVQSKISGDSDDDQ